MNPDKFKSICVLCTLAAGAVSAAAAGAQERSSRAADRAVEEIVVTGSLIRRDGYDQRVPVQVVDREDIELAGHANVIDIARDLPVNAGSELTQETGDLLGVAQFNLRGLGLGSTLTLLNGRRAGISAVADGGGNEFVDINQFPLSMIERIEIQTDGASATYGSQAVGGVVNIITRSGFEGFELAARAEGASNDAHSLSFASGAATDRASFNVYGTYYHQRRNDRSDFDWLVDRIGGGGDPLQSRLTSSTGAPGSYVAAVTDPATGTISRFSNSTFPDPDCTAAGGILRGSRCRHDFFDQVSVIPEEDRLQVFSELDYELHERLAFFSEAHFSRNRINRTQGPGLFQNGLVDNGSIFVPADHPFNFFVADPAADTGIAYVDPAVWDNAVHQAVDVVAIARPFGARFNGEGNAGDREVDLDYWRFLGGLRLELPGDWTGELVYQTAHSRRAFNTVFNFIADAINQAAVDGSWNPFGTALADPNLVSPKDGVSVAGNDPFVLDSLSTNEQSTHKARQYTVDAVFSGELAEFRGGAIAAAAGAQYRFENFSFVPDALKAAGESQSPDPQPGASGDQDVVSLFAETIVPFGELIELQAAVRYEDYDEQGGDTTDPKLAARYQPTEWLGIRGSYGSSFQAPSSRQTSISSTRQVFDDPASVNPATGALECVDRGVQISGEVRVAGDETLRPQSADNFNLGVVLEPLDGLSISLDYWNFDYRDLITLDEGAQAIIENDCADDGIPNDPRVERDSGGNIRLVNSNFINTGSVETDGFDLVLDYGFETANLGGVNLTTAATFIDSFEVRNDAGSAPFDAVGSRNFRNQFRSLPELRANLSASWFYGSHAVTGTVRYIDSYLNDQNDEEIASFTTFDLRYEYEWDSPFSDAPTFVSVGANNLFDEDPPSLGEGTRPGYDPTVHSVRGRILYMSLIQEF